jgi:predicted component of type VI protein secretion system
LGHTRFLPAGCGAQESNMPKLTVMTDGVVIKEIELDKPRTTLGRRPYNDIVIDNLAISGEHAVLLLQDGQVTIEDLNSTNGSYVNGKAIRSAPLHDGDLVEIGRYRIRFEQAGPAAPATPTAAPAPARIRVLAGPAAGREAPLLKAVTTLGQPGIAVVSITQRAGGYQLTRLSGPAAPRLNGSELGAEPVPLRDQDLIELAETRLQFLLD